MAVKTPVKATFTGSDVTGLAEYQAADFIGVADGGTGAVSFTAGILIADGTNAFSTVSAPTGSIVGTSDTQTLTNKTIDASNNTISNIGVSSLTNSSFTLVDDSSSSTSISLGETLKITGSGGVTSTVSGDTLTISVDGSIVTESSTDTLTNKTIDTANNTITIVEADISDLQSYITASSTDTLTNKTIDASSNTLSNIGNSSLTNSSITVTDGTTSTATSLGGTITFSGTSNEIEVSESSGTITVGLPNDVTIGNDLTVTGDLTVNGTTTTVNSTTIEITNSFTFEGSTADAFETTLGVIDPTADRTINLPNASGTIVLQDTTDTLTNKTINTASNTITIVEADISDLQSYITASSTDTLTNKTISGSSNTITALDATSIADGSISNTEFQFLNGVSSNIQTQLDAKATNAFAIAQAVALG